MSLLRGRWSWSGRGAGLGAPIQMNDQSDNRQAELSSVDTGLRGLLAALQPGENLTAISGRFRNPGMEEAFLRDNLRATRQYLMILAVVAIAGAAMGVFASAVRLPTGSVSFQTGLGLRALLAAAAVLAIMNLERIRRPGWLFGLNASLLALGLVVVGLRMSVPGPAPDEWSSVFHVTRDGVTVLLVVSMAQLMLVPGWFGINAVICAVAFAFYNIVAHAAPDPAPNPLNLTYASTAAFLFVLAMGASAQRLRRSSFLTNVRLRNANFQLNELATQDYLTGCANRRHFYALAEAELARSRRYRRDLSVVLLDLDHFKSINDRYGHAAGDMVLHDLAEAIRATLRELDTLGRIGGEEFALLLPETSAPEAHRIAERLREMIEDLRVHCDGADLSVTASFGVTERQPDDAGIDALIRRADFALYEAKAAGRNRVVVTDTGKAVSFSRG